MESRSQDWIDAASCHTGPRTAATFADLPDAYRADMLRVVLAAAATTACLVLLGALLSRLPSRNLAAPVLLPHPVPARGSLLESHLSIASLEASPAPARPRPMRAQAAVALTPAAASPQTSSAPERKGNIFSRMFRGLTRRNTPAPAIKANPSS
jgi:hypothetical protein